MLGGQTATHWRHAMHSLASTRRPTETYSGIRRSIGQTVAQASDAQLRQASASPATLTSAGLLVTRSGTDTGQAYLQKARLSRNATASATPTTQ